MGYDKFPVTRPVPGRPLLVRRDKDLDDVEAVAGTRRSSGVVIVIEGTPYDSNHDIYWRYSN